MAVVSPRASRRAYQTVRIDNENSAEHRRELAEAINSIIQGNLNAVGTVTLTISSATTVLTDPRIGPDSYINFMPTTANAAAELTTLYVTGRVDGSATINHANNANADRIFSYLVIG